MSEHKPKILFLIHLYPPVYGAGSIGEYIRGSKIINSRFLCDFVRISTVPISKSDVFINKIVCLFNLYLKTTLLLLRNEYDLIYVSPCASRLAFYKDFGLCVLAKLRGPKIVYHFHDKGISKNKYISDPVRRFFFRDVSVILSSMYLYYDIKNYVNLDSTYTIPYGIPDDDFTQSAQPELKKGAINIIFFSHMMREKGVFDLIEACALLNSRGIKFRCNFVGGWYDISENEFNHYVISRGLNECVAFLGPQYGEDKNAVLRQADIFAFPTFYNGECFPLGLLEAMKMGLPIVSTNEGAIPDIIDDGFSGFIVEKRDVASFADKLELLLRNPKLRFEMGEAGRMKFEKRFTLPAFENGLINIFRELAVN